MNVRSYLDGRCQRWSLALSIVFCLCAHPTTGQTHQLLLLDDPAYLFIERLQERGYLLDLNPTALPYTEGAVRAALESVDLSHLSGADRLWFDRLRARFEPERTTYVMAGLRTGLRLLNTRRDDVLRPQDEDPFAYPYAEVRAVGGTGPVVAAFGLRHDVYYDRDPDGLDAARRLMVRPENGYAGFNGGPFSVYLGRVARHWAPYSVAGLVLSANPRAVDHLALHIGTRTLSVTSLLGELDNLSADSVYRGEAFEIGSIRRFLAAHRVDWRPSPRLTLSLIESVLYSGAASGLSLRYLNPFQAFLFEADNRPKNDDNNVLLGLQVWSLLGRVTLQGQVLLDDVALEKKVPPRLAVVAGLRYAPSGMRLGVDVEVVGSETYNTRQKMGQYIYLNRGLATPFSDYVMATAYAEWYEGSLLPGVALRPYATALVQGDRDFHLPMARRGDATWVLHGAVNRTIRTAVRARVQPQPWWWFDADLGINTTKPSGERSTVRFSGRLHVGLMFRYTH